MGTTRIGWWPAVVLLAACGCANSMSGTLDGQKVGPARSAIYDEAEMSMSVPGFGELVSLQVLRVFVSGFPDACALYDRIYDVDYTSCEETCEDLHEIAAAFTRILTGIYHHRPQYPHQREEDRTRSGGRAKKESRARLPANGRSRSSDGGRSEDAPAAGEEDPRRARPL